VKELVALLAVSIVIGSAAGFIASSSDIKQIIEDKVPEETGETQREFVPGTAHEHALFYVAVDGEVLTFTEDRYQLAARHVHLENNKSDIVHKHAEGVRWSDFFETIDLKVNRSGEEVCLEVKNVSRCDTGEIFLDGEPENPVDSEIAQDQRFIISIGENASQKLQELKKRQVPEAYQPQATRGRQV
jgi:hypothetical protein